MSLYAKTFILIVLLVPDLLELFQVFDAHVVVACLADRLQIVQRRLTARGGRLDMTALEGVERVWESIARVGPNGELQKKNEERTPSFFCFTHVFVFLLFWNGKLWTDHANGEEKV